MARNYMRSFCLSLCGLLVCLLPVLQWRMLFRELYQKVCRFLLTPLFLHRPCRIQRVSALRRTTVFPSKAFFNKYIIYFYPVLYNHGLRVFRHIFFSHDSFAVSKSPSSIKSSYIMTVCVLYISQPFYGYKIG